MSELFVGDQMKNSLFLGYCYTESDIRKNLEDDMGKYELSLFIFKNIFVLFYDSNTFYISISDALRAFPPK